MLIVIAEYRMAMSYLSLLLCSCTALAVRIKQEPIYALIAVATGTQGLEFFPVRDRLVRAGYEVTVATVSKNQPVVMMDGQTNLVVSKSFKDIENQSFNVIVLPGGGLGAAALRDSHYLKSIVRKARDDGKWIAAICVAPTVILGSWGFLPPQYTCFDCNHPGVVISGKTITADGPDRAEDFANAIVQNVN